MTAITENVTINADLTYKQRIALMNVIDSALMGGHYEIKRFETKQYDDGDLSVTIVTGIPNDEGTLAEALCRDYYIFAIGRKGGIYKYVESRSGEYVRKYFKYYAIPKEF